MKTTLSWLKAHLATEAPLENVVERLIMLGHDVDGGCPLFLSRAPLTAPRDPGGGSSGVAPDVAVHRANFPRETFDAEKWRA